MCGSSSTSSTTESTAQMDPLDRQAKQVAINAGLGIMNQSYPGYDPRKRVEGFNADQTGAFGQVRNYSQSPVNLASERIVDQTGRLGSISDYMDPHLAAALQPAIRDIQKAGQINRNQIGANATFAGAFGDQRHGIAEGEQMRGEQQNIGDLTSTAYSNAFQTAMGQRGSDLDRFQQADLMKDEMTLNRALSLLGIGDQQQQTGQQQRDADYQEFLSAREWPFRQFDLLPSVLSGTPTAQTSTTTTKQPNNSLSSAIGSLLGGFF